MRKGFVLLLFGLGFVVGCGSSGGAQITPTGFTPTGSMGSARLTHTATLLGDGKVLVAGGQIDVSHLLATAELYDPASGSFAPTGSMQAGRSEQTATLLKDGKVLIAGERRTPTRTPSQLQNFTIPPAEPLRPLAA